MRVMYKCQCMDKEAEITVRERRFDEDILHWMEQVQLVLGLDHSVRSPACQSLVTEYVKIPIDETRGFIGTTPTKH